MGLFTESELGCRYDLFDYKFRTWHMDRHDILMAEYIAGRKKLRRKYGREPSPQEEKENMLSEGFVDEECKIGRNERDSNPNFRLKIYENREWDVNEKGWVPDGRFVLDFIWPYDSDAKGIEAKKCPCDPKDLKDLADFISNFIASFEDTYNVWGINSTTQTKIDNKYKAKYDFNSKYLLTYYKHDLIFEDQEEMDFNLSITRYNFRLKAFEMTVPAYKWSKSINQPVDIVMTPLQLKEFAKFLYSVLN